MMRDTVKGIVADVLGIEASELVASQQFSDIAPLFDEGDQFDIIVDIEDEFGISIDEDVGRHLTTVDEIVEHLKTLGVEEEDEE